MSPGRYQSKAKHNERFTIFLGETDSESKYLDWYVNAVFYSALFFVKYRLAEKNEIVEDVPHVELVIMTERKLSSTAAEKLDRLLNGRRKTQYTPKDIYNSGKA